MSENTQVRAPFSERVVTDYSTLPAGYMERVQRRADEIAARRAASQSEQDEQRQAS